MLGKHMAGYWRWQTRAGTASIVFSPRARNYRLHLADDDLGGYRLPQQAVDDFCGGHTFAPSSGVDTATLGTPADLGDWEFVRQASLRP